MSARLSTHKPSSPPDDSPSIAQLVLTHRSFPRKVEIKIEAGAPCIFGRKYLEQFWPIDLPTISTSHIHFHSVVFDATDDHCIILPLVYFRVLSSNSVLLCEGNEPDSQQTLVSRSDDDILLVTGNLLYLTADVSALFIQPEIPCSGELKLNDVQQLECMRFGKQHNITKRIVGRGGLYNVFLTWNWSASRQLACKIVARPPNVKKGQANTDNDVQKAAAEQEKLAREYQVLVSLSHPNIIQLDSVICTPHHLYIFEELVTGGDLYSLISAPTLVTEPAAVIIVRQILEGVRYLHDRGIVHRDIKPENILIASSQPGSRVVLTDFGQARMVPIQGTTAGRMKTAVGTDGYRAPEISCSKGEDLPSSGYTRAVDIWSIGCVTAALLTGVEPSDVTPWASMSRPCRDFIQQCRQLAPHDRPTAQEALLHKLFTNKIYAAELDAAYEWAVEKWHRRDCEECLIEYVDTEPQVSAWLESRKKHRHCPEGIIRH